MNWKKLNRDAIVSTQAEVAVALNILTKARANGVNEFMTKEDRTELAVAFEILQNWEEKLRKKADKE